MTPRRRSRRPGLAVLLATVVLAACVGSNPTPPPIPTGGATPAGADCPTAQPAALPAGETRTVRIETAKGTIDIRVSADLSPIAAGNFAALAACGYYDGVAFHRAATLGDGTPFVIQGGDPTGTGTGGPGYTIIDEPVTATYRRGTVAMARTPEPNSQGSQFFIVLSDAGGPILASYNTYAIFGDVVAGMDAVDAIHTAADAELPTNPITMDRVTVSTP